MVVATLLVAVTGACSNDDDDDSAEKPVPPEWTATTLDRSAGDGTAGDVDVDEASEDDNGDDNGDGDVDQIAAPDAEATPEQDVAATYEAFWERREHALKFPDPDDPGLADVASGAALDELTDTVTHLEQVGQQGQFGALDSHHVYDVQIAGDTTATVSDCALSDARITVIATGEVVRTDPPEGAPFIYTATLLRSDDGRWRVDDLSRVPLMGDQLCSNDGPVGQGS
jgi:hypothetical protein